jgi:mono/diheme cytochrome c family protein
MNRTWMLTFAAVAVLSGQCEAAESNAGVMAAKAQAVLQTHCHRCHGENGAVEGGMNYILNRDKLVAKNKIVAGAPDRSPLFRRVNSGKMPPPEESVRPTAAEVSLLRDWIAAGAPATTESPAKQPLLTDGDVFRMMLADLEGVEKRSRRFMRYINLAAVANAGAREDELQTYRAALAKLVNTLSWHPHICVPKPVGPGGVLLRIDLRDFLWDANVWNRVLAEYPYGIVPETTAAKACIVLTACRLPVVRGDWFLATASRPPLYHEILQLPATVAELERQLRVDAVADIQQERVARAGFNGSGVSKNNRLIERHDAAHGAYWRTYDFEAIRENLVERDNLLPDRRNLFAYPLGPGFTANSFQHAGGEIVFNLPNGLQGYLLVNAQGTRIDRAPTAIVSDPKRPDRAVETGLSCIGCHAAGILPKSDQIREHVRKNPKLVSVSERELIEALYASEKRMTKLMDEDAERFRRALEKCGVPGGTAEPITTLVLRYESDVDLPAAAAEVGMPTADFAAAIRKSESLARNLGALLVTGGSAARPVVVQSFADLTHALALGRVVQPAASGLTLPDNTGDIDPLEGDSNIANAAAFSPDGRRVLFACADRGLKLWDVEHERELHRFVGHSASVWCVAFSPDGRQALSGGADQSVRLWDVETGLELRRFDGHTGLVSAVIFAADGRTAASAAFDATVRLWNLSNGRERLAVDAKKYVNALAFAPNGKTLVVAADKRLSVLDAGNGNELWRLEEQPVAAVCVAFSSDGARIVCGGEKGSVKVLDAATGKKLAAFQGPGKSVLTAQFASGGTTVITAGADRILRWWDLTTGKEARALTTGNDSILAFSMTGGGEISAAFANATVRTWTIAPSK